MSRFKVGALGLGVCLLLAVSVKAAAQTPATPDSPAIPQDGTVAASPQAVVPRLMKFNGVLRDVTGKPVTGPVDVTFALYSSEAGGNPLWFETQSVEPDEQGRYTALIGVMHSEGLPMDLFTTGEARWLGVQVANEVEQKPRVLLLSVPYALKASDAETLGGLPSSAYMLSLSASAAGGQAAGGGNGGNSVQKGVSRKNTACSSLTADGNASANQIALYSAPCALSEDANLVDVGGKVGIGTADPTEGGQVGSRFTLSTATDAATGFSIFTGAAKRFAINTQSSGGFLFYDGHGAVWNPGLSQVGGNVGIGTADPTMSGQVGSRLTISTSTDAATGFSIFTGSAKRFALNTQSSGGFLIYDGGGGAWNPGLSQVGGKVGIGTAAPAQALDVVGNVRIGATGYGLIFPDGTVQKTAGAGQGGGTITGVFAGTDLTGGGTAGGVTLNLDTTKIPQLATTNTFAADQSLNAALNLAQTTGADVGVINLGGNSLIHACCPKSTWNTFVGTSAGNFAADATGSNSGNGQNTATGFQALTALTSGYENTASGFRALYFNTTGHLNTASGFDALLANRSGNSNVAIGYEAGLYLQSGSANVMVGPGAGQNFTSSESNNIDIGNSGVATESGVIRIGTGGTQTKTFIAGITGVTPSGASPLPVIIDSNGQLGTGTGGGGGGTITGVTAGTDLTGGGTSGNVTLNLDTTKVPTLAASSNSFTGSITASGFSGDGTNLANVNAAKLGGLLPTAFQPAGSYAVTTGANSFAGAQTVTTGDVSITNGNLDLPTTTGSGVGVITLGGASFAHSFGAQNTFVGQGAGNFSMTGTGYNTATGSSALSSNTTGPYNSAFGTNSLGSNTAGGLNTATGAVALYSNTQGSSNTADGYGALNMNTTGSYNTAVGGSALQYNCTAVSGACAGANNTALGYGAGVTSTQANANITGANNTFIGYNSGPGTSTQLNNATAIGENALVSVSNALVLGGTGPDAVNVGIGTATPSQTLEVVGGNVKITTSGNGLIFADGTKQTTAGGGGGGTITGVTAGTDLTGGGTSGTVTLNVDTTKVVTGVTAGTDLTGGGTGGVLTLNLDTTKVPTLGASNNTFTGSITAASFSGNGSALTSLNASNISGGTLPSSVFSGTYSNALTFSNASNSFTGNGSGLTNLNASNLSSGTLPSSALSGTYSNAVTLSNASNSFTGSSGTFSGSNTSQIVSVTQANSSGAALTGTNSSSGAYGRLGTNASGAATGVYGSAVVGYGVYGTTSTSGGTGVYGSGATGVSGYGTYVGVSASSAGGDGVDASGYTNGVYASSATGYGVYASGHTTGVYGSGSSNGVYGYGTGSVSTGVYGYSSDSTYGTGVEGDVAGGSGSEAYAVWGYNSGTGGYAGYFTGNVYATGTITGPVHFSVTDHPLNPADKYLYHASVESSEMKNIYDGIVSLDASGEAVVKLPEWFEAVNADFRYQLTAIGAPAPGLYIAEEISSHQFKIAGGRPGTKVSWQVTGVRQDAYAKAHPLQVEVDKPDNERGYYIHPELYGAPPEKSMEWANRPDAMRRMQEMRQKTRETEKVAKP